jgi:hypothetical protein
MLPIQRGQTNTLPHEKRALQPLRKDESKALPAEARLIVKDKRQAVTFSNAIPESVPGQISGLDSDTGGNKDSQLNDRAPASVGSTKAARLQYLKSLTSDPRLHRVLDVWELAQVSYLTNLMDPSS